MSLCRRNPLARPKVAPRYDLENSDIAPGPRPGKRACPVLWESTVGTARNAQAKETYERLQMAFPRRAYALKIVTITLTFRDSGY